RRGDRVVRHLINVADGDVLAGQRWIVPDLARAVERLSDDRAERQRRGVEQRREAGVHRAVGVVEVARGVDVGRLAILEAVVPYLHAPGYQLDDQQAVGDVPDAILVRAGVGDLHAALVIILHQSQAARSFHVALLQPGGEGLAVR